MKIFSFIVVIIAFGWTYAARNEAEESICQPFLTSKLTSPLIPTLSRNLTIDEDGEFSCELVLQDETLPHQIRATIHEGLFWMHIRHTEMGLPSHAMAIRHMDLLHRMLPKMHVFALRLSFWLMSPHVSDVGRAVEVLHDGVYGDASTDQRLTDDAKYQMHRDYARALGVLGQYDAMRHEYSELLKAFPYNFYLSFMVKVMSEDDCRPNSGNNVDELLAPSKSLYKAISSQATNNYTGFVIPDPKTWKPQTFDRLLTVDEFRGFRERREPFVVSLGGRFDEILGWRTSHWTDDNYLINQVGDVEVLVETQPTNSTRGNCSKSMGFGLDVHHRVLPFRKFAETYRDKTSLYRMYLNIQEKSPRNSDSIYRSPLHVLKDDLPFYDMVREVLDDMSEVNLWMGHAHQSSTSRLHMDATDNLYHVIQGKKTFRIFSPEQSLNLETIAPTFAVAANGLSFRFDGVKIPLAGAPSQYYHYLDAANSHFSALDRKAVDERGCPVELSQGDILYLPTGWFHQVTSHQGQHKAINYWWKPPQWRDMVSVEREAALQVSDSLSSFFSEDGNKPIVSAQVEVHAQ